MSLQQLVLCNERLTVNIASPGTLYRGSRFDWSGFITQVNLDDQHTFCVPESLEEGKGSGGCGLCGEFGIRMPIGYDEAQVGECFPKLGVGNLIKPDDAPYDFFRPYTVNPAEWEVDANDTEAVFSMRSQPCNGYRYSYTKKITLDNNRLTIAYILQNTGDKPIETNEYCHNFVGIDNTPVGPQYKLRLPATAVVKLLQGDLIVSDAAATVTWPIGPMKQEFYCTVTPSCAQEQFSWELINSTAGVGVREKDDFIPSDFAIWGSNHVISPESFVSISIKPGQTQQWMREYEFFYIEER